MTATEPARWQLLRSRAAGAIPRIPYAEIAEEAGYSHGYVKQVLSGAVLHADRAEDNVEAAMDRIETRRGRARRAA